MRGRRANSPARLAVACATALAAACATGGVGSMVGEVAIPAVRKMILGAASTNYQADYTEDLERLLDRVLGAGRIRPGGSGDPLREGPHAPTVATLDPGPRPTEGAEEPSPSLAEEVEPLALDVAVLREAVVDGRSVPEPLEDGAVVHDGYGRPDDGDNLKLTFRANQRCWVYVVAVDSTGWAQPLFPGGLGGGTNPVEPGRTVSIPEGSLWMYLDAYRGTETFFFVASRTPRPDLEEVLAGLSARSRPVLPPEVSTIQGETGVARGLAGVRPGAGTTVQTRDGVVHENVGSQRFLGQLGGADLVITRWLRHE